MRAKQVNESLKIKGDVFDVIKLNKFDKVLAGKSGILGNNSVIISWDIIQRMIQKYKQ